jgi:tRNA pseudouridine38-40 synthase
MENQARVEPDFNSCTFEKSSGLTGDHNEKTVLAMQRYFIRLAYRGTAYCGWQRQPNGISVQQVLEEALSMMLRLPVRLTGAGRTDSGVHASEYFAHFDLPAPCPDRKMDKLLFRLNAYLGPDIAIYRIFLVKPESHARFTALSRTYQYYIASEKDPFRSGLTMAMPGTLDVDLMNKGAELIRKTSDFTSFSKVDTDTRTNLCRVDHARWEWQGSELVFTIRADRFLRNMVRAIVGTLLKVGRGRLSLAELQEIIESLNRSRAGMSAPACGLHLVKIEYPEDL